TKAWSSSSLAMKLQSYPTPSIAIRALGADSSTLEPCLKFSILPLSWLLGAMYSLANLLPVSVSPHAQKSHIPLDVHFFNVEARLVEFRNQEIKFCEKIRGLELMVESKSNRVECLTNELEILKKEKEGLDSKLTDDTITDYSRPSPNIESKSNDLQNNSTSVFENAESTSSILSKPEIKFVIATDSPTIIKTSKDETVRKPSIKYAEMYRKPLKSSNVRGNQRN
nr:hypothetical protein [Tanacetum cinerariifolium]